MHGTDELLNDPVGVLLTESDPVLRARAHRALGERALSRQDLLVASDHLREALDLDPTDEVPRKLLARVQESQRPRRRWLPFL
jgi:Tfp pilus assembly protein PilF